MATTTGATKKTSYRKRTPEQIAAEHDALRARQREGIMALMDSDQWRRFLLAGSLFRKYSANNTMLILVQCPQATQVAGFKVWKALNRKVVSGPGSSIKIWGRPPRTTLWVEEDAVKPETKVLARKDGKVKIEGSYTRCPILSVFDISQTEGAEIAVTSALGAGTEGEREIAEEVWERSLAYLDAEGWTVEVAPIPGTARGFTSHQAKTVTIREGMDVLDRARTVLHEIAHVVLHGDSTWAPVDEYHSCNAHRGLAEVQAESVAFTLANFFGLDTEAMSTGYVAGWAMSAAGSQEQDALLAVVEKTMKAVHAGVTTAWKGLGGEEADEEAQPQETDAAAVQQDMTTAA